MNSLHPLLETHELAELDASQYIVVETDRTPQHFDDGHIPGSVFWPMTEFLLPDFGLKVETEHFAKLMSKAGIMPDTLVVCAHNGDPAMAGWSAWLYWILTGFGHTHAAVLNGGTPKWRSEGRPLETTTVGRQETQYPVPLEFRGEQRALIIDVKAATAAAIIDTRTLEEFRGEHYFNAPPREGEKAGRIPGAVHLPYDDLIDSEGRYLSAEQLKAAYGDIEADCEVIPYCTMGMRSALVWFVFSELVGFNRVRNYDGSWNEWSRSGMAVEK